VRNLITAFLRFALGLFFRRIEVLGTENVPRDGAVIFAVNHPNGLVDPLFVLCFAPLPVSFLGKAPLFTYPVIGWIVRAFDTIPVYRRQDHTAGTNAETFGRARDVLQRHGSIAIFPEGTTHDDPQLRALKTGAARIALGANVEELSIVPTGIYYTAKHAFRSSALVVFGRPMRVKPVACDATGEPPADDVVRVTAAIDEGLDKVTLQADSHAALDLVARAEDIFSGDPGQPLATELDLRRRFTEGYHFLRERYPARLEMLESKIARFEAELTRAGLSVHELRPAIDAARLARLVVLLPLAVAGAVTHYATYRLVGVLARRVSKGEGNLVATVKFIAALALYPVTYVVVALLIGWIFGSIPALVALVALPVVGYAALRVVEDADDVVGELRAVAHRLFRGYGHRRLLVQRESIRDEMLAVAREMDRSGSA
jgi:glycerol-3-phosphate O-acyltransferase/dihydroxyacetone phosphate acyltransferase